jgi:hypothetical protein
MYGLLWFGYCHVTSVKWWSPYIARGRAKDKSIGFADIIGYFNKYPLPDCSKTFIKEARRDCVKI